MFQFGDKHASWLLEPWVEAPTFSVILSRGMATGQRPKAKKFPLLAICHNLTFM